MAKIVVRRVWPDLDRLVVSVEVDASYPDALNEARATVIAAYREALGLTLTGNEDD
jgi:hypothetical protein